MLSIKMSKAHFNGQGINPLHPLKLRKTSFRDFIDLMLSTKMSKAHFSGQGINPLHTLKSVLINQTTQTSCLCLAMDKSPALATKNLFFEILKIHNAN
jgi:hypothetical protein